MQLGIHHMNFAHPGGNGETARLPVEPVLAESINVPQPLQQPRPPILIGGGGEKKTLRLLARYADAGEQVIPRLAEIGS